METIYLHDDGDWDVLGNGWNTPVHALLGIYDSFLFAKTKELMSRVIVSVVMFNMHYSCNPYCSSVEVYSCGT